MALSVQYRCLVASKVMAALGQGAQVFAIEVAVMIDPMGREACLC